MSKLITPVYAGRAQWHRHAYLKLVDDKVVFDCSDEEYGPIEFDIKILKDAIIDHMYGGPGNADEVSDWDSTLSDGMEDILD